MRVGHRDGNRLGWLVAANSLAGETSAAGEAGASSFATRGRRAGGARTRAARGSCGSPACGRARRPRRRSSRSGRAWRARLRGPALAAACSCSCSCSRPYGSRGSRSPSPRSGGGGATASPRPGYLDRLVLNPWLELVGSALLACAALVVGMLLARRLGPRWWLAGAPAPRRGRRRGGRAPAARPRAQARPAPGQRPRREIQALGSRLGVEVDRVEVRQASERTTRANAEVYGLGSTRTVVLWDTLLDGRYRDDEIRFLAAHELAHVERPMSGRARVAGAARASARLAPRARGRLEDRARCRERSSSWRCSSSRCCRSTNAISRRYEAEADRLALRATREPEAAERTFRRLVAHEPRRAGSADVGAGSSSGRTRRSRTGSVRARSSSAAPRAGS